MVERRDGWPWALKARRSKLRGALGPLSALLAVATLASCGAIEPLVISGEAPPSALKAPGERVVYEGVAGMIGECTRGPLCQNACEGALHVSLLGGGTQRFDEVACLGSDYTPERCGHVPKVSGPLVRCEAPDGSLIPGGASGRFYADAEGRLMRWELTYVPESP